MKFGAAWYPEHWPESRWPEDLRLMKEARMNVVRLAEFAWSRMEPKEGAYDFAWLENAVEMAAKSGIKSVLGTPTAAPPAWLTQKYPDTLNIEAHGFRTQHGNRCHYNPWSDTYRRFSRQITSEMARRFGNNPNVIGWQTDNEFNHLSYDPETRAAFQDFLKARFGGLERLNELWSGAYWSEDYSDWSQIPLPVGGHNPGLRLEYQRFCSHTYKTFQKEQCDAIRVHAGSRQWITHNFMGWFGLFDHYELNEDLDLASWDSYCPSGTPDAAAEAVIHDLTRGFKRKNFWLMETQPNTVNWSDVNTMLEPGRLRLRNLQAVAHGADAVLYWQWRSAPGGQEQMHGTVVGQDGKPRPAYGEIQRIGSELAAASSALEGSAPSNQVAFLNSYDSRWALGFQPMTKDYDYVRHFTELSRPYFELGAGLDVVNSVDALAGYKLVVAPSLWLLEVKAAANLEAFVKAGGHLVLTIRSGNKDHDNRLFSRLPPGPLADLAGVEVEECYPLLEALPVRPKGKGKAGTARVWAERLRALGAVETWHSFGKGVGWLEGFPAVVSRKLGKGRVTTLAGWFDHALSKDLAARCLKLAGAMPALVPPAGVEFAWRRGADGSRLLFVLNHSDKPAALKLPQGADLLSGAKSKGSTIPAREVWLLKLKESK